MLVSRHKLIGYRTRTDSVRYGTFALSFRRLTSSDTDFHLYLSSSDRRTGRSEGRFVAIQSFRQQRSTRRQCIIVSSRLRSVRICQEAVIIEPVSEFPGNLDCPASSRMAIIERVLPCV